LTLNANEEKSQEWVKEKWNLRKKCRLPKWGEGHAPWGRMDGSQGAELLPRMFIYRQISELPSEDSESLDLGCGPRICILPSTLGPQEILRQMGNRHEHGLAQPPTPCSLLQSQDFVFCCLIATFRSQQESLLRGIKTD